MAIIRTCDVFFSFILQKLILNIKADLLSIIGGFSIILGIFTIFLFNIIQNNYENDNDDHSGDLDKNNVNNDAKKKSKNIFLRCILFKF